MTHRTPWCLCRTGYKPSFESFNRFKVLFGCSFVNHQIFLYIHDAHCINYVSSEHTLYSNKLLIVGSYPFYNTRQTSLPWQINNYMNSSYNLLLIPHYCNLRIRILPLFHQNMPESNNNHSNHSLVSKKAPSEDKPVNADYSMDDALASN